MRIRLSIATFLLSAIAAVNADIIPTLSSTAPTSGAFTWNYSTNLTVDQMIQPGDFFTIYDFGSFNSGSNMQPSNWTFSSALAGKNPSLVSVLDNASLLNLTWTYTGSTPINVAGLLGIFSVVTNTDQLRTSDFASEATRNSGPTAGTKIDNVGTISVPVPEVPAFLPVMIVCGAALGVSLPACLRRRRMT